MAYVSDIPLSPIIADGNKVQSSSVRKNTFSNQFDLIEIKTFGKIQNLTGIKRNRKSRRKVKFIYSEKATKFCEIFTLLLTVCTVVKSKVKISQNFVAFSEYMNFTFLPEFRYCLQNFDQRS